MQFLFLYSFPDEDHFSILKEDSGIKKLCSTILPVMNSGILQDEPTKKLSRAFSKAIKIAIVTQTLISQESKTNAQEFPAVSNRNFSMEHYLSGMY